MLLTIILIALVVVLVITTINYGIKYNATKKRNYELAYRDWETDRKSTRLNSSHSAKSRMPSSA